MLRGDAVGLRHHLLVGIAQDDLAVIAPGDAGNVGGRQTGELAIDLRLDLVRDLRRGGQQDRRRCRAVLGLAEQVGGAHLGVGGVIGDNQRLGRTGQQVDADAAEQLPLGLGDKALPGPTSISTGGMLAVPSAMAATAWMPPSR